MIAGIIGMKGMNRKFNQRYTTQHSLLYPLFSDVTNVCCTDVRLGMDGPGASK